jgi:hypothetical protein
MISNKDFKPWWEKVNDFQNFSELDEFKRGAMGYRPSNPSDIILGIMRSGWVRTKFEKPEPYTGKKKQ